MLTDIFFIILASFVSIISAIFRSVVGVVVPSQVGQAFTDFFSFASAGNGIFPMTDVMLALFTVINVWIALYILKVALFGFSLVPWIGKALNLPTHTMSTTRIDTVRDGKVSHEKEFVEETRQTKRRWM